MCGGSLCQFWPPSRLYFCLKYSYSGHGTNVFFFWACTKTSITPFWLVDMLPKFHWWFFGSISKFLGKIFLTQIFSPFLPHFTRFSWKNQFWPCNFWFSPNNTWKWHKSVYLPCQSTSSVDLGPLEWFRGRKLALSFNFHRRHRKMLKNDPPDHYRPPRFAPLWANGAKFSNSVKRAWK